MVILIVGTIIGIFFVMRYAEKVKKDPAKSLIYDQKAENEKQFMSGSAEGTDFGKFTGRHKVILFLFFLAFVVMVYGVIPWADLGLPVPTWWWWFPEMTAYFLFFGILIGIIGRLPEKVLVDTFVDGARDMLGVALIIGVARGITVIMNNGLITDTVLYWAEQAVSGLSSVAFIIVMYLLYLPLSFLIPSSSGLATVSMPIMAPLSQFAGVPSYLVVTAYQTANGLVNLVTPTSAVVMGGLAIARVGYGVWWRFVPVVADLAAGGSKHPGARSGHAGLRARGEEDAMVTNGNETLDVPNSAARSEMGKALRAQAPRATHAAWKPAPDRRDPIDVLEASSLGRVPELIPIRYGRMLASPFAFLRGSAAVMAGDLAATPASGIFVQACGDCHLSNFGLFATPERNLVFDLNDFDETLPAPWEWDIKRLAASFVVAGRENGITESSLSGGGARPGRRVSYAAA